MCESSARQQAIHMKCQVLFSLKNNKILLEYCLLQIYLVLEDLKIGYLELLHYGIRLLVFWQ